VHVRVDNAGQQGRVAQVEHGRGHGGVGRQHGGDAAAAHQHQGGARAGGRDDGGASQG